MAEVRLPDWIRQTASASVWRWNPRRQANQATAVKFTFTVDTATFVAAMDRAAKATGRLSERFRRGAEIRQAGWYARLYVQGGLDPAYATPEARDAAIKVILRDYGSADLAAAFAHGWAVHRGEGRPVVIWHRQLGDTAVKVGVS